VSQVPNSTKIRQVKTELMHVERRKDLRTDRHGEVGALPNYA